MAERAHFTIDSAARIAKVVRAVEGGNRDQGALTFGNRGVSGNAKLFRVCTYTGAWSVGSTKTVTFKNQTATPNTVSATNLFFPVTNTASAARDCAIARDGTQWYLIDVGLRTATAVFVTGTQSTAIMTDVTLSASLNTSACTISIGKTLVTASRIFVTSTVTATYVQME